ncbi:class I adenylate-forming enzyme family protein [Microbacterium sp. NC79]|uniref:class I adenylate-forming enzyme family protein n=1 Tax=Microbacterium sp. NC79 TaxID=2851009 RepID=UPI001C2BBA17|nr:class I adenylate-forming enzyme family protein [Microbacterium sp. NC79]MBV0894135.1 acyl--CoA ligase [Microbacterium sp. NC79]
MTSPRTKEDIFAELTAPDSLFEVRTETVLGHPSQVFHNLTTTLGGVLEESARYGDAEYLVAGDLRLSYLEHRDWARATAALLRDRHGVVKGDRVMILGHNGPEWLLAFWAITSLGAIAVAGNSMGVGSELEHQISLTEPVVVLADRDLQERLASCDVEGEHIVSLEQTVAYARTQYPDAQAITADVGLDDPAVIIFTSGTTGRPKGSVHSHRNVVTAAWFHLFSDAMIRAMGMERPRRTYLLVSPLFHIASLHNLAVARIVTGDRVVMSLGKFSVSNILQLIESERITNWGAVPTMIARVLAEDTSAYDLTSLRTLTVNSAPSSPTLKAAFRERFPWLAGSFSTTYGLTESSSAATVGTPAMLEADPESVGTPIVTMEVEIRGDDGTVKPDGEEGEVFLRGALVMMGYYGMGERGGIDENGWFGTGDIGRIEGGELRLRSRRSDLIIRGAQNVYPAEVENALAAHPEIEESIVFGVDDEEWGQEVAAIIVLTPESTLTIDDIVAHLEQRLARYKRPTFIRLRAEPLLRNATGKVIRKDPLLVVTAEDRVA